MKKIFLFIMILLCFGCSDKVSTIKKASSDSLTYLFFKDLDIKHYVVYFFDRNVSNNDDSIIVIGRDDDKYYYEYNGSDKRKIIQIDGFKYTVSDDLKSYTKVESEVDDYSLGILPNDISKLRTQGYKTGKAKVFNYRYTFEEYKFDSFTVVYYFKGKKLIYIKSISPISTSLIKFDKFGKVDKKMFKISNDYNEISY